MSFAASQHDVEATSESIEGATKIDSDFGTLYVVKHGSSISIYYSPEMDAIKIMQALHDEAFVEHYQKIDRERWRATWGRSYDDDLKTYQASQKAAFGEAAEQIKEFGLDTIRSIPGGEGAYALYVVTEEGGVLAYIGGRLVEIKDDVLGLGSAIINNPGKAASIAGLYIALGTNILKSTAPRRATGARWGEKIEYNSGTQPAMDHIRDGHFYNSRPGARSSRFLESNSTPGHIKELVDEAFAKGKHTRNGRGEYSIVHTFDDIIGTDINGRKTSTMQIFLDEFGNVINAYPITRP